MKPGTEATGATSTGRQRRSVRLFVALHLGAVGAIYAIALLVGGGFAGPPMPSPTVAMANPPALPAAAVPTAALRSAPATAPAPLPEWTRRPEIAAPWESR